MYLKTTLLIFSVVFSVVYNIPRFLEFETVVGNRTNEEDNSTISNETVSNYLKSHLNKKVNTITTCRLQQTHFVATNLRLDSTYIHVYVFWMKFLIIELIPYLAILILNGMIIYK